MPRAGPTARIAKAANRASTSRFMSFPVPDLPSSAPPPLRDDGARQGIDRLEDITPNVIDQFIDRSDTNDAGRQACAAPRRRSPGHRNLPVRFFGTIIVYSMEDTCFVRRAPIPCHGRSPRGLAALLEQEIIFGRLPPSARLTEEEVALRYGVSRSPVREALRLLERDGLVLREARRGIWVAPLSLKDFDEIYACRIELEGLAADGAARSRDKLRKKAPSPACSPSSKTAAARGDAQEFFLVDVRGSAPTYELARQPDADAPARRPRKAGAALPLPRLSAQPEDRRPVAGGHRPDL